MSTPVFFAPLNFAENFSRRARVKLKGTHDAYQIKRLSETNPMMYYTYMQLCSIKSSTAHGKIRTFQQQTSRGIFKMRKFAVLSQGYGCDIPAKTNSSSELSASSRLVLSIFISSAKLSASFGLELTLSQKSRPVLCQSCIYQIQQETGCQFCTRADFSLKLPPSCALELTLAPY